MSIRPGRRVSPISVAVKLQKELKQHILDMSVKLFSDEEIKNISYQFMQLYHADFRHFYSDFFPIILEIADDDTYNFDFLSANLENVRNHINVLAMGDPDFDKIYPAIFKLCDHLNLEIGRLNYYSKNDKIVGEIERSFRDLRDELKKSTIDLNEAREKMSSLQTELIAVLSIFAAIVLAFSGGIAYLGSALSGMASTPLLKSTFIIILCGLVLFNAVFLLMYVVAKITGRSIYARCKTVDCTCEKRCWSIKRLRKRLSYVYWFNIMLVILLVLNGIALRIDPNFLSL